MPKPKITVVLVHGAWAECASWNEIIVPLQKEGLGCRLRSHPADQSKR